MGIHEICLNFKEKILNTENNSLSKNIPINKIQDTFLDAFNMDKNEAKRIIKSLDDKDESLVVEEDEEENIRYVIPNYKKQYLTEKTDVFIGNRKKYVIFNKAEELVIIKDTNNLSDLLLLEDETYQDIVSFNNNQYLYKFTPYAITSDLYNLTGKDGNKLKITKKKDYTISIFEVTDEVLKFIKKNEYFCVIYELETEQIHMDKENYVRFDPYQETREYICPCSCSKKIKKQRKRKRKSTSNEDNEDSEDNENTEPTELINNNENTEPTELINNNENTKNTELIEDDMENQKREKNDNMSETTDETISETTDNNETEHNSSYDDNLILPNIYFHYTKHKGIFAGFVVNTNDEIIDDENRIINILHDAYKYNSLFYTYLITNGYSSIKVIRNLHYDKYVHNKTYHFNIVLESENKISPVFHAYVENEQMTRLTVVTDILSMKQHAH
jgi:hypothetical protein